MTSQSPSCRHWTRTLSTHSNRPPWFSDSSASSCFTISLTSCWHLPAVSAQYRQHRIRLLTECQQKQASDLGRVQLVSAPNFWSHFRESSSTRHENTRGSAPISGTSFNCHTHKLQFTWRHFVRTCRKCIYNARLQVVNYTKYAVGPHYAKEQWQL